MDLNQREIRPTVLTSQEAKDLEKLWRAANWTKTAQPDPVFLADKLFRTINHLYAKIDALEKAVEEEREECAKIAETIEQSIDGINSPQLVGAAIAYQIRARGEA